jgi:hypothetical protein
MDILSDNDILSIVESMQDIQSIQNFCASHNRALSVCRNNKRRICIHLLRLIGFTEFSTRDPVCEIVRFLQANGRFD